MFSPSLLDFVHGHWKGSRVLISRYRKHVVRVSISLVILTVFLLHVTKAVRFDAIDALELFAYDQRLKLTTTRIRDDRVVIIDIDEKSLAAEGRWPWGRDKLARLVDTLFDDYQIGLVGFDVVFAERDESSGLTVLRRLADSDFRGDSRFAARVKQLESKLDYDRRFARSIANRPVVLGYTFNIGTRVATRAGELPAPTFAPGEFTGRRVAFYEADGYVGNLPELADAALAAGHFTIIPDADGIARRVPMLFQYKGAQYEALSLAMARTAMGVDTIVPGYAKGSKAGAAYSGLEWLQVGNRRVPVDARLRTLVPFRGRQGSFPYVSATDVLHGEVTRDTLAGRIALVGTSAPGLLDLRATPVQAAYPGVEVHANIIAGILDNKLKNNPAYTLGAEFALVTVAGLLMTLLLPLLSPLWGTVATLALLAGVVAINMVVWQGWNIVLPLASVVVILLVMYLFNTTYSLFVETRGKRQLAGLFGQYVPPELVDEMSEDPGAFTLEGESREMTVLFSDVRSFTTISEGLDPRELSRLMNEYLTPMTTTIHDARGTIDKYIGDAIMAFWGAPLRDPEHAQNALQAAFGMLAALRDLQVDFERRGWPAIRIGIGINTGTMNVGNMGSEFRMAYTVLGDAVNLGSRLEGLTKGYGVECVVSETTARAAPELIYRELDRVRVKGKDKPVTIFEPVGARKDVDRSVRDELKLYEAGLKLYRAQNWDMAELQFLNLQKSSPPSRLYQLYAERIAHFRREPPGQDWDGVFTHLTK